MPNAGLQSTILRAVLGKNGLHFRKIFQKLRIFSPNWVKEINSIQSSFGLSFVSSK